MSKLLKGFCYAIIKIMVLIAPQITPVVISQSQKEHYKPNDVPHDRFSVAVMNDDGDYYRVYWRDLSTNINPIFDKPTHPCNDETYLTRLDNATYRYTIESALQTEFSEYQIKDNQVIPISFAYHNTDIFLSA